MWKYFYSSETASAYVCFPTSSHFLNQVHHVDREQKESAERKAVSPRQKQSYHFSNIKSDTTSPPSNMTSPSENQLCVWPSTAFWETISWTSLLWWLTPSLPQSKHIIGQVKPFTSATLLIPANGSSLAFTGRNHIHSLSFHLGITSSNLLVPINLPVLLCLDSKLLK